MDALFHRTRAQWSGSAPLALRLSVAHWWVPTAAKTTVVAGRATAVAPTKGATTVVPPGSGPLYSAADAGFNNQPTLQIDTAAVGLRGTLSAAINPPYTAWWVGALATVTVSYCFALGLNPYVANFHGSGLWKSEANNGVGTGAGPSAAAVGTKASYVQTIAANQEIRMYRNGALVASGTNIRVAAALSQMCFAFGYAPSASTLGTYGESGLANGVWSATQVAAWHNQYLKPRYAL